MNTNDIQAPYLLFLGAETQITYAKTGAGLAQWRPELCVGQFILPGGTVDLGLPSISLQEAVKAGVKSVVIGTAPVGGRVPKQWVPYLEEALSLGMDIASGLHQRLNSIEIIRVAAKTFGRRLIDVRLPPSELPVASGVSRQGNRLLMVGTDCAVGKKYTALQIERDMCKLGIDADFRATGQTGIMIAGSGIPIDAVISDFVSGAAELISPQNSPDHWDVIEGQGSIYHPGYCAVSMGLLVGSQPDAFVVCHEAKRQNIMGWSSFKLPSIQQVIDRTVEIGKQVNPNIECVGISINSSNLPINERQDYIDSLSSEIGLPCVDPMLNGTESIVRFMASKHLCNPSSEN